MKIRKKYRLGYTQGTFDMFHIGHLNLLRHAKEQCEKLIVGVNSDTLVIQYKHKNPIINDCERLEIVKALRVVDDVIMCNTLDKEDAWKKIQFDAIFIGSDWKGDERWKQTEHDMASHGAIVVYLPHTEGISSTKLREELTQKNSECCQYKYRGGVIRILGIQQVYMICFILGT